MYSREKQFRQENQKPKKSHRNTPSFSSSLLDEICRSIDENPPKPDQTARFSRVEKWMENDKTVSKRRPKCENAVFPDNDLSVSDTTPLGRPSASDTAANRPNPVRTGRQKDSYLFDEYEAHERNRAGGEDLNLIKSKSRAMKFYSNLKKMKQPISPGARLTSFINSIFNRKKSKETNRNDGGGGGGGGGAAKKTTTCWRPPLPPNAFRSQRKCDLDDDDDDDDDELSESSCELFELDHMSFGNKERFSQELPVYETTYFDRRFIR